MSADPAFPASQAFPAAIVVAGDAFMDLTSVRTADGNPGHEPHPGGSCLNVAVGLGRLGVPTALLARISGDGFGHRIRAHLTSSGVQSSHLLAATELTGLGVADVVDGVAGYAFHTAAAADRELRPEHLADLPDAGRLPAGAALHLGSIALLQEPQASTLDALLRRESGHRLVTLDPNVRPSLITDRAGYLTRLADWVARADIVKVSDEDLVWLFPGETPESVAAGWLAAGAALVLVTYGAAGAWATTSRAQSRVPAPSVEVVDTVGAGDAFMAGALAHLHRAGSLTRAAVSALDEAALHALLTDAAAIAADTCTRPGAQPPYRPDLAQPPAPSTAALAPTSATSAAGSTSATSSSSPGPTPATAGTSPAVPLSFAELVERARTLAGGGRRILGLTGPPGSGKTTLARDLASALGPELAVVVPVDGFHLANRTLVATARRGRKGAWDTFDADGYLHLLARLRTGGELVHAPDFDRDADESIGSALPVPAGVPLVITEGNYLLLDRDPWTRVAALLDESWYLEVDDRTRHDRLVHRHEQHGLDHTRAESWAAGTDATNAQLITTTRPRASLVIRRT